jgi:hypothetical protein
MFWGQHNLGWLAFYDFAGRVGVTYRPEEIDVLDLWLRVGRSTCWWQPREGFVLMCDRAGELHIDEEGRLHSIDGMAMKFRDGWGVWSLNGVQVDEQIVMTPDAQTLSQIKGEKNEEIKRIRIERYAGRDARSVDGWQRYLKEVGAKAAHQRRNDIDNTDEAIFAADGMTIFVGSCRSTGRIYALEVPAEVKTCEHAQTWMRSGSWLERDHPKLKRRLIGAA